MIVLTTTKMHFHYFLIGLVSVVITKKISSNFNFFFTKKLYVKVAFTKKARAMLSLANGKETESNGYLKKFQN